MADKAAAVDKVALADRAGKVEKAVIAIMSLPCFLHPQKPGQMAVEEAQAIQVVPVVQAALAAMSQLR